MPKPDTRFAPGTVEKVSPSASESGFERYALTAILFLLFMSAGFCLASLLGYIETRGVFA